MQIEARLVRSDESAVRTRVEDGPQVIHEGVRYERTELTYFVGAGGPNVRTFLEAAPSRKPKDVATEMDNDEWLDSLGEGARRDMLS